MADKITEEVLEQKMTEAAKKAGIIISENIAEQINDKVKSCFDDMAKAENERKIKAEASNEDGTGGFKNINHFFHDVVKAGPYGRDSSKSLSAWRDKVKAASTTGQTVGVAEEGGYIIPAKFSNQLLELATKDSDIYSRAQKIPIVGSNRIEIPYVDGFDESQGVVSGGIKFYWTEELGSITASKMKFKTLELKLRKASGLAYASDEMLRFSPSAIGPMLERQFEKGLRKTLSRAYIRGTGAGEPLGVLNADCKIEVAKETGQAADTIQIENIVKMGARIYNDGDSLGNAVWYANPTIQPQLLLLSQAVGTGGQVMYMGNVKDDPGWRLLGRPIVFSDQMSALGDAGDIMLADWSDYLIAVPEGMGMPEMTESIHVMYLYDQKAFKFTFYTDGQPWWSSPFTPEYGDTRSMAVTLAERA
jgi:HK97 family phage major capsid protein